MKTILSKNGMFEVGVANAEAAIDIAAKKHREYLHSCGAERCEKCGIITCIPVWAIRRYLCRECANATIIKKEGMGMHTAIKSGSFAEACYDQNSIDELKIALSEEPDETDMQTWNITPTEYYEQIALALVARLEDLQN